MDAMYEGHRIFYTTQKKYPAIWLNGRITKIHTIVMEKKLGRQLKSGEVIHHIDNDVNNFSEDNLICFATNRDHLGYHSGNDIYFDDEGVAHCKFKSNKIKCPICGNLMTPNARTCKNCRIQSSRKPSKDILIQDLSEISNFTKIGKKYGVTSNAVKKWCKSYGIYEYKFTLLPDPTEFISYLETHTLVEAAIHYDVPKSTICSWISRMNLIIVERKIICVETQQIFNSCKEAAEKLYPNLSNKSVRPRICKVVDTDRAYKGLHWKSIPRKVMRIK